MRATGISPKCKLRLDGAQVYSASQPVWRERSCLYLPKPWASPRQLWTTISKLLGIPTPTCAGD